MWWFAERLDVSEREGEARMILGVEQLGTAWDGSGQGMSKGGRSLVLDTFTLKRLLDTQGRR